MKTLRYKGEFVSQTGEVFRVELRQEATSPFVVGDLTFPADTPLLIEWDEKGKEEVLCGSTATLKIISPGDRTYDDLYSIAPGDILLHVYRKTGAATWSLYWSGALDPEFYEEPYESASGYEVSLTFSDFGIFDRIDYDLTTPATDARRLLEACLLHAGIYTEGDDGPAYHIDESLISSSINNGDPDGEASWRQMSLYDVAVQSANFFDEEGNAVSLKEALEGILQPLALKVVQRAGVVYVYDLNGLYLSVNTAPIEWSGASQTYSADKVANKVVVTFSPYSSGTAILNDEIVANAPENVTPANGFDVLTDEWESDIAFTVRMCGEDGSGVAEIGEGCQYVKAIPALQDTEFDAVSYGLSRDLHAHVNVSNRKWTRSDQFVLKSRRVWLPPLSDADREKFRLRITEEILFDHRRNYESSEKLALDETMKIKTGWAFIPVKIELYRSEEGDDCWFHYENRDIAMTFTRPLRRVVSGSWHFGDAADGDCWLEYYKPDNLPDDTGLRGWQTNRATIGRPDEKALKDMVANGVINYFPPIFVAQDGKLPKPFCDMDSGEFIPYPPMGGWLQITIGCGLIAHDYGQKCGTNGHTNTSLEYFQRTKAWNDKGLYNLFWTAYKAPVVELRSVKTTTTVATFAGQHKEWAVRYETIEDSDVEYSGEMIETAQEELSLSTICGTMAEPNPLARGLLLNGNTGYAITAIRRGGEENSPENLLIRTIIANYGVRRPKLSGETASDYAGLTAYTERAQGGRYFVKVGTSQDLITGTEDATFAELVPDSISI